MEARGEREKRRAAYRQVMRKKGAAGGDGLPVDALRPFLQERWADIKESLVSGTYHPQPVLRGEIPKPEGKGKRQLGLPTVGDRLIQQALHQILAPGFEPGFSSQSYGFIRGRNAHQAVLAARHLVASGYRWVVDGDVEKFFDRVNHDVLMARIARRVKEKRVLVLIGRFLQAGGMAGGVVSPTQEGTPQGGPLSPLLSNIL